MDGTIATLHHGISPVAAYSFPKRVNSGAYLGACRPARSLRQRYHYVTGREVRILHYSHYRIAYVIPEETGDIDILGAFPGALRAFA